MAIITNSSQYKALKATLDNIVTDKNDGLERGLIFPKYLDRESMSDAYADDAETAGPGLAYETAEGTELQTGQFYEGYTTRYWARKFGLRMQVSEEAMEDGKYEKYIDAARRLKRAMFKTMEIDAANILNRAANSAYVGGDGLSLANSAHTLPGGGTFSNTLSTAFAPSRAALIVVTTNCLKLPGHDGITEGYAPRKIVFPIDQWAVWEGITGSSQVPESGNNELNVINRNSQGAKYELVGVKYWTSSTPWGVKTEAENGLKWMDRKKPKSNTWVEASNEVMNYSISGRWARGWSNPRGWYFSNA